MTGLELVVRYLAASAWRKARLVAGRANAPLNGCTPAAATPTR
jgi:hypothetical protein